MQNAGCYKDILVNECSVTFSKDVPLCVYGYSVTFLLSTKHILTRYPIMCVSSPKGEKVYPASRRRST